jgi:hypothetical protein
MYLNVTVFTLSFNVKCTLKWKQHLRLSDNEVFSATFYGYDFYFNNNLTF